MKKLLLLFSLLLSFNSYGGSFIDFSLSDFCYQQPNVQDRGGVFYYPNEEIGITDSSLCVYKDLYGQYMSKVELVNGKFEGKFIRWWENGQKHQDKNYNDGKLVGKWIEWWDDGRVMFERNYVNGKKVSETTFSYYDDGQIETKYSYKDTHLDGEQTVWYENGQMKLQFNASGMGKAISWYENGQIKTEAIIKNGLLEGKETSWYENGLKRSESNFKYGKKDGKWTWWTSEGLKWKEAIFVNDERVGDCKYFNETGPWDEFTDEGFAIPDLCAPKPKGITLGEPLNDDEYENTLKSAYLNNISARVRSFWRYQGAEDDWECEVYVVQDRDGTVVAVDVRNCNVDDSGRAKAFKDSVRRAVYKSSPLPSAPDESVFDKELMITFSVN